MSALAQYIPGPRTRAGQVGELGASVLDTLLNIGASAAANYAADNVKVTLKTNLTPEITLYDPSSSGPGGLLQRLGVQASVILYDANGNQIATLPQGAPIPATDPVKVAIALSLVASLGYLLVRGVLAHR